MMAYCWVVSVVILASIYDINAIPDAINTSSTNTSMPSWITEVTPFTEDQACGIKDLSVRKSQNDSSSIELTWDPRLITSCGTPKQDYYVQCTTTREDLYVPSKYVKASYNSIQENRVGHSFTIKWTLESRSDLQQYCAVGILNGKALYISRIITVDIPFTPKYSATFIAGISVCALAVILLIFGAIALNRISKRKPQKRNAKQCVPVPTISANIKAEHETKPVQPQLTPLGLQPTEHKTEQSMYHQNLVHSSYSPSAPPLKCIDGDQPSRYAAYNPAFEDV